MVKPDRSHHCRACRKCVLKYDHHCYIINNCIGFYNYKFFFLLLFYLVIMMTFVILSSIEAMKMYYQELGLWAFDTIFFAVFLIINFAVFYFSLTLFIFHVQIIYKGLTSVENLRINNNPDSSDHQLLSKKSSEDSLENTFGSNFWSWFLPTGDLLINYKIFIFLFCFCSYFRQN